MRRNTALHVPPGRAVKDYRLVGEKGEVRFAELFGHKDTFVVYTYMYGAEARAAVPDVHIASVSNGEAKDMMQRVGLGASRVRRSSGLSRSRMSAAGAPCRFTRTCRRIFRAIIHAIGPNDDDYPGLDYQARG